MPAQQPTLDGTLPTPADDYDTWETEVWPTFVAAARSGRPFVCWRIAQAHDLPNPPCQELHWARLMSHLRRERIVRYDGFGLARDKSACRRWRGTAEAIAGRIA
ncbi:hypothetical protein [Streptomyces aureus]